MVLLSRKEIDTIIPLDIQEGEVMTKNFVKYIGVTLDRKLTFWSQLRQAEDEAAARVAALNQIMPNVRGPKPAKHRLLMYMAQSIILYEAEIWEDEMNVVNKRVKIGQV
ncbi:uncharacterized protein LOC111644003 [Copidosoma floridanum]|uniref:uncharacterized protein LOC111644003 n=1 Tax=Copidosoma floridanum TaxID=29053 RepID=UPI000C6F68DE|nr:uncharacterized protein LOC111644003 [Copidosoma floridanum]